MQRLKLAPLGLVILGLLATSANADDLTIYSGRSEKFVKPLIDNFSKKTGIKVNLTSGNSSMLLSLMSIEDKDTKADLYIANDAANLQRGSQFDLFAPLPKKILANTPKDWRASDDTWIGLSGRARVLVVNNNSEAGKKIDSVFDLADPRLKRKIAITRASNESFISGASAYRYLAGQQKVVSWLIGIRENAEGAIFRKHSQVVKAVASGRREIGLVNHYYVFRHLKKNPKAPIRVIMPDQNTIGAAWNMAGIALSKYSRDKEAALAFIAYLSSADGQEVFAQANKEFPANPKVKADPAVEALKKYTFARVPMEELGRNREPTVGHIRYAQMEW